MFPANAVKFSGKRVRAHFILSVLLGACSIAANTAFADGDRGKLRVMTQNLYDGTNRTGLLAATTFAEFLAAVDLPIAI